MSLSEAIEKNRKREARFDKAERMLRRLRLRVFDYEDNKRADQCGRLIDRCKERLKPRWEAQDAIRRSKNTHWMYAAEN